MLLGVHVPHALGSAPVLLGAVYLFLQLPIILGMPVLWLVVYSTGGRGGWVKTEIKLNHKTTLALRKPITGLVLLPLADQEAI